MKTQLQNKNADNYLDCYLRVSTRGQKEDGNSIDVQRDWGKRVADRLNKEVRFHLEGTDGVRSSTTQHRPVYESIKDKIISGEIRNVWFETRSRFWRTGSYEGYKYYEKYVKRFGVKLYEGDAGSIIKFDTAHDRMIFNLMNDLQKLNNEERSENSRRGKHYLLTVKSKNKPVFLGGDCLFGYINIEKEWRINRDESKWVKWIFDNYEKGLSTKEIKIHLDKNLVQPRRSRTGLWHLETIQKMLQNRTYTGLHTVRVFDNKISKEEYDEMINTKDGHLYSRKGIQYRKVIETHSYAVDKIISVAQFNRVQKIIKSRTTIATNQYKHESLLLNLLYCECGQRFGSRQNQFVRDGKKFDTKKYYCVSKQYFWKRHNKDNSCKNSKSLQMDKANKFVLDKVKEVVSNSHILKEEFKNKVMGQKKEKEKDLRETTKKLEKRSHRIMKEIDTLESQISELTMKVTLEDDVKKRRKYEKILQKFNEGLEERHTALQGTEKEIDDLGKDKVWLDWIAKYGQDIKLRTKDESKQKEFLKRYVDKIIVKSEYGSNRYSDNVQIGHSLDIHFRLKIVDDKLNKLSKNEYAIEQGKNNWKSEVQSFITSRKLG